jgi:hypothetical protein
MHQAGDKDRQRWPDERILSFEFIDERHFKASYVVGINRPFLALGMLQINPFVTMARLYTEVGAGIFYESVAGGMEVAVERARSCACRDFPREASI